MADPQDLAAHRQRRQILSVVQDNRVTMIVGDTGCGKSTQVPKILLDQVGGRVLCTQPRRLAVVAVASRVAEELGEELGGSVVGYHIGQDARAHEHTKLVFSTIGIALEQIKSLGLAALTRYSCIIVDEVHERSAESDVVLACIRQLAPHAPHLKLVLMSATAEPRIYQDFFAGVDYAIVALAKDMTVHHILEKSLEHALDRVERGGGGGDDDAAARRRTAGLGPLINDGLREQTFDGGPVAALEQTQYLMARLIVSLLAELKDNKSGHRTVLAFLPTYRALETQHALLSKYAPHAPLHLLHSSVDMEECMAALAGLGGGVPRVVLASAVAESSITIEGVAAVVDAGRACEVYWSPIDGTTRSRLVWCSHSQLRQRAGRTGRTCDGVAWRLLPKRLLDNLEPAETPAVRLLPLRRESLLLTCSAAMQTNQATALLARCLEPPDEKNVDGALKALVQMRAITVDEAAAAPRKNKSKKKERRGMYRPTAVGVLLDALPVSLETAQFVLHAAICGYFSEALTLGALQSTCPVPLRREPNQAAKFNALLAQYGPDDVDESSAEGTLIANLVAFEVWQRTLIDVQTWRRGQRAVAAVVERDAMVEACGGSDEGAAAARETARRAAALREQEAAEKDVEEEVLWCTSRSMSRTALHAALATRSLLAEALFRLNPPLLHLALRAPRDLSPAAGSPRRLMPKLVSRDLGRRLAKLLELLRPEKVMNVPGAAIVPPASQVLGWNGDPNSTGTPGAGVVPQACAFFLRGACNRPDCPYSHSAAAERPWCKYADQAGGCKFGSRCLFRHPKPVAGDENAAQQAAEDSVRDAATSAEMQEAVQRGLQHLDDQCHSVRSTGVFTGMMGANALEPFDYLNLTSVWTLGDGDLSWSRMIAAKAAAHEAGSRALRPSGLVATTLLSFDKLKRAHPEFGESCVDALTGYGATVLHGVDATALHAREHAEVDAQVGRLHALPVGGRATDGSLLPAACALVWHFPRAHDASLVEQHQELVRKFFFSSMVAASQHAPLMYAELHVTLRPDEFAKYYTLAAAEAHFYWLRCMHAFEPGRGGGRRGGVIGAYTPRCNDTDEPCLIENAITYVFRFDSLRCAQAATLATRRETLAGGADDWGALCGQ